MRPQAKHLLLVFAMILTTSTLVSGSFTFAYWNEVPLQEAISRDLVRVEIRGIAEDGRFRQPMLEINLSKQSIWPLTVIIPRGLRLTTSEKSEVIVLQTEQILLLLRPNSKRLLAYSLDYHQAFPNNDAIFKINKFENNDNLISILNQITTLEIEEELANQLAVWMTVQGVELEEIENTLGADFSEQRERVNEIIKSSSDTPIPPPSEFQWWLIYSTLFCITLALWLIWYEKLFDIFSRYLRLKDNFSEDTTTTTIDSNDSQLANPQLPQKDSSNNPINAATNNDGSSSVSYQPNQERLFERLKNWECLTVGGMAEIWVAYDQDSNQKFIVKFPKVNVKGRQITLHTITKRFENEITYHQMMHHENIVKFIEAGSCTHPKSRRKTKYLILEFIDGKTIHQLISSHQYIRIDTMMEIIQQITNALTYIHQKKVVHRDITLKNIMIDQSGRVYLIDFGNVAKFDSKITDVIDIQRVGTEPFYPPLDKVGSFPAYDYYSLAVLIYAMYTGKHVIGRKQERVKEEISQWYDQHSSKVPIVVRNALAWYVDGKYHNNQECSEKIKNNHFFSDYFHLSLLMYLISTNKPIIGHSQAQVKEEIKRWYHPDANEVPIMIRKILTSYLEKEL